MSTLSPGEYEHIEIDSASAEMSDSKGFGSQDETFTFKLVSPTEGLATGPLRLSAKMQLLSNGLLHVSGDDITYQRVR